MADHSHNPPGETHEVFNVPPPLTGYNAYREDVALQDAVKVGNASHRSPELTIQGRRVGEPEWQNLGFEANANPPVLETHDRWGHRLDRAHYHPAYHQLMERAIKLELHAGPWRKPGDGAQVGRAALLYLQTQLEQGHGCPITMTFAGIPVIRNSPALAESWLPGLLSRQYDPSDRPSSEKAGLTLGMAMTEKQGGSDVRANTTRARETDGYYHLTGHKFFMSAPNSDGFLTLAQAEGGLTCFLVPRWRSDGQRNGLKLQRLKNKLGNVSNASSEVELVSAEGILLGEPGRGVATIIDMVALTRFDCTLASAAAMRQAAVQAIHHCVHRRAFGQSLVRQPLMQNVLADLVVESEAALQLAMRLARSLDHRGDPQEQLFLRLATALGKYWVCKRVAGHSVEAMECLGGSGAMNEFMTARLYREAPINAIWEGSGNIQCLDVLRTLQKAPESLELFMQEVGRSRGVDARLDGRIRELEQHLAQRETAEFSARTLVETMAVVLQASLLLRHSDGRVADAFIATRIEQPMGLYGSLPKGTPASAIIARALPMYA
ncbi:acyl-CoA dehydrogenase family protein [Marinimicrobium sp. ARAG 43.8]|uniref:acyl-CoA dehydrogenase family protein n=1 Tax=Marinimicrobium sp. ARAG 43.8 TaxID=3418719 RepID=UPI003CEF657C